MEKQQWYKDWFNSPYYHILYQHRDDTDAQLLIKRLLEKLKPSATDEILDLACGRGRHAIFLNQLGYRVTGLDLAQSNVAHAQQFENPTLHFEQGDMRETYGEDRFNYILNLFTSFGYFKQKEENQQAVFRMAEALKPKGTLVIDFMNVNKVKLGLVKEEVRTINNITFTINRTLRDDRVIKEIAFVDEGKQHRYEEKVQLFTMEHFEELLAKAGLQIVNVYGDFELNPFDERNSERLLLFAQHK